MKTKQLFITLISSVLLTACSTDDSIINDEKNNQTLESLNSSKSKIEEDLSNCTYKDSIYIYYSNYSISKSIDYVVKPITEYNLEKIYSLREDYISNDIYNPTINGCPLYKIPEIPSLKYNNRRKQYYETWDILFYTGKPRGGEDDIEL